MIKQLEVQTTGNQDLELLMQNLKKFSKVLEDNPLLDGVHIAHTSMIAGNTTINHGLARVPRGYIVTDQHGTVGGPPFESMERVSWDASTLVLASSGICCVGLWIF